jgi:hypothetical protein
MLPGQLSFLAPATAATATSLIGLTVQMEGRADKPCRCGETALVVGSPKGPHVGSLYCSSCNRHRGWLPKKAADFLNECLRTFGTGSTFHIRNFAERD